MGDYTFTQKYCIGEGSYGKVYRGLNKRTNRQVAIKEMDVQLITEEEIRKEITILKQLKHPNIVEYEDAFQVKELLLRIMAIFTLLPNIAEEEISGILWTVMKKTNSKNKEKYSTCSGKFVRDSNIYSNLISSTEI